MESQSGLYVAAAGYGLAAVGYAILGGLTLSRYRQRLQSAALSAALLITAVWGLAYALGGGFLAALPPAVFLVESLLDLVWLYFLSKLMAGAVGSPLIRLIRYGPVILAALVVVIGLALSLAGAGQPVLVPGQILTSLAALVVLEQVFRNARQGQRRGLKYLCLALGALFTFDLLLYSLAVVNSGLSEAMWSARGFVALLTLPLLVVALRRSPVWGGGIFVSRHVVFHSATIVTAGLFLTVVGFAGQWVRSAGVSWGEAASIVILAFAALGAAVLLVSTRVRNELQTFLSKHFFENKYDYRTEWLRLIATLTGGDSELPLSKRSVRALCDITSAPGGLLWFVDETSDNMVVASGWNRSADLPPIPDASHIVAFVERSGWVIDFAELAAHPERYSGLAIEPGPFGVDESGFLVPLLHGDRLIGVIALNRPPEGLSMTYEDRDLLKTAGKQVASYLAQEQATELLAQSRQFEAYNRLTAYLMHDLKNVIAQQALVVENARKHSSNPAFVEDAISTIRGGVARMRKVMEQLRQGTVRPANDRVELGALLMTAVSACADREPVPTLSMGEERCWVRGDRDRLQMALVHAIRNAQDASESTGTVGIAVTETAGDYEIAIADDGIGMDAAFVRDRLFRPFDSTKGAQGMGIGAHQIRETVRGAGGTVFVDSAPGAGTTFRLVLPKADQQDDSGRAVDSGEDAA